MCGPGLLCLTGWLIILHNDYDGRQYTNSKTLEKIGSLKEICQKKTLVNHLLKHTMKTIWICPSIYQESNSFLSFYIWLSSNIIYNKIDREPLFSFHLRLPLYLFICDNIVPTIQIRILQPWKPEDQGLI